VNARPPYYDLYELDRVPPAGDQAGGVRECHTLAFVAVPPGLPAPELGVTAKHARYPADRVLLLLGIDHLITSGVDVINCSLGFDSPYDPDDPVVRAVGAAIGAGICFVVAAGNYGPRDCSMQQLAFVPGVISVGATTPDGLPLASSSRGGRTMPGPTVVADGTSHFKPKFSMVVDFSGTGPGEEPTIRHAPAPEAPGTSFATPVVSRQAAFVGKVLAASAGLLTANPGPVRLPVVGLLDTGFDPDFGQLGEFGPLSKQVLESGHDQVVIDGIEAEQQWCRTLATRVPLPSLTVTVDIVRRALASMARPVGEAEPWVVGAGLVSDDAAEAFCADLTPSRLLGVLAPDTLQKLSPAFASDLDAALGPLWARERVTMLTDLFRSGIRLSVCRIA
jgi:hypothetical protein